MNELPENTVKVYAGDVEMQYWYNQLPPEDGLYFCKLSVIEWNNKADQTIVLIKDDMILFPGDKDFWLIGQFTEIMFIGPIKFPSFSVWQEVENG